MRLHSKIGLSLLTGFAFFILNFSFSSCGIYSFNDIGTIPDSVKTVKINIIENRAPYVNPQLSPTLTDRLKQKITSQTRLASTTNEAHWEINGEIRDYSVSTSGVSTNNTGRQQASINRLTVTVHITRISHLENKTDEYDVSRSFDFSSSKSLQQAENELLDEMIRNLTDEIFNRIFSNW
ncbi:MAG TPA: LPS assembly lipoprotein LptE [Flavisolibacter sp.]|nr:LPS assembly lipoprotein LptE [Flavisolibacter sp.]